MEETHNKENALFAHHLPLDENTSHASSTEFAIGQLVALRSDPTRVGAIINIVPGTPENRYLVFLENTPSTYYASQLQHHELTSPSLIITPLPVFHAYMTALQLNHPSLATLYSLHAARVNFIPYQFQPVLKRTDPVSSLQTRWVWAKLLKPGLSYASYKHERMSVQF